MPDEYRTTRGGSTVLKPLILLHALVVSAALAPGAQAAPQPGAQAASMAAGGAPVVVVLAGAGDPYRALAADIASRESIRLVSTLDDALALRPEFLLWVAAPGRLSDAIVTAFSMALDRAEPRVAAGLITGSTLESARALYDRAGRAGGERAFGVVGAHVLPAPQIVTIEQGRVQSRPLRDGAEVLALLEQADYIHYSGHGGTGYWRLSDDIRLTARDIPALPPVVVSAFSCQTARVWEPGSIALRMVDQGAAAYSGFYYSPLAGFHIGDYRGLPFRLTFPEFPIGAAVLAVNEGARAAYAHVAFHILVGDPRISLRRAAPYRLAGDVVGDGVRALAAEGVPAGIVPVRVPAGRRYEFAEVGGLGGHWQRQPFYDRRIQMMAIGTDRFLLVEHPGGRLDLRLRNGPPLAWLLSAPLVALLDDNLIVLADPRHGGDLISLVLGLVSAAGVGWRVHRRRELRRLAVPAVMIGAAAALLHGAYAYARHADVAVTTKPIAFNPLAMPGTLLLCSSGALLFLGAKTWRGKALGVVTATLTAWVGIAFTAAMSAVTNRLIASATGQDVGIYSYGGSWRILGGAVVGCAASWAVFSVVRRGLERHGVGGPRAPVTQAP